jgi:hypothetical protein
MKSPVRGLNVPKPVRARGSASGSSSSATRRSSGDGAHGRTAWLSGSGGSATEEGRRESGSTALTGARDQGRGGSEWWCRVVLAGSLEDRRVDQAEHVLATGLGVERVIRRPLFRLRRQGSQSARSPPRVRSSAVPPLRIRFGDARGQASSRRRARPRRACRRCRS